MNKDDLIEKLAEKNKIPEADVKEIFEEKLEESQDAGLKGDEALERAMKRTWGAFKRKDMSSSVGVEGVILGAGDRYDAVSYSREESIEAYQQNPQKAIKSGKVALAVPPGEESNITGNGVSKLGEKNGWAIIAKSAFEQLMQYDFAEKGSAETDDANTEVEDGWRVYPLDDRETFGSGSTNQSYGMPQDKHSWTRRCVGVFITEDSEEAMRGQLTLRGSKSAQNPPLNEPLQFKARVNEADDEEMLYINSSNETEFNPNPALDDQLPGVDTLIEKYFPEGQWRFELDELYEHLQDVNGSRTVVVEGDVIDMNLEPTGNDTFRMVIGQLTFQGGEMKEREATVWIPAWQDQYIDFAVESRVYVIGRARMQDAYDPQAGQRTSEKQEVVINAQGLYAEPTSKIPREENVEEMDDEDVEFSANGQEEEAEQEDEAEVEFAASDGGEGEW